MKTFIKINAVSIFYAILLFVPFILMINVYRISRLTGMDIELVNLFITGTLVLAIIAGTFCMMNLRKIRLSGSKANYFTAILWIPYFFVFMYTFANALPITYGGDKPNPVTGLFLMGSFIIYPIYILVFQSIATNFKDKFFITE
ncbi:hypothetical protein [Sutcliffiella rhizosphaerae]|uniref:DUF805 domain-containing protein n=1 Tax=Sutcliffiella rhizosphaerae TaxID=2880967 RepID=A0ABN8ACV4_9BACI|nr:hypothetical protein [Sutcliffiella rhizosphaerae]CAG9621277.1 hypothetical protein BACCIP111883_02049 [Sutcliffiella rhizosphaerae]